jgi:Na+/H+ antiporter NhaD/arsenite permease-like protein
LGTLFVNISIGGVLTHFAAPPVLMVARVWQWDSGFMFTHFGWKAALACAANAGIASVLGRADLKRARTTSAQERDDRRIPGWLKLSHVFLLTLIVLASQHAAIFMGIFLLFLGISEIAREFESDLKLKESLLVACFLAGLVVLGSLQSWWLKPLISGLSQTPMFLAAAALTAVTDNAALTYLGSRIPGLSGALKYALLAGAVAGGGLTVIANAPNPAGFAILRDRFGREGISAWQLFLGALLPTVVALAALGLL